MNQNELLTTDHVCNENKNQFSELTAAAAGEEEDNVTDETSDVISTSMLTPPPTGESLLNGSSGNSISGNDLQQFTNDEGISNQSSNSDSADSKLIINEGSIDSSDVSNIVYNKLHETTTDAQMNPENSDECGSSTLTGDDVSTKNTLDEVIPENATATVEFASTVEKNEKLSNFNAPLFQPIKNVSEENNTNVPLQTVNGVMCQDNGDLIQEIESENRSANETDTKHRKLKRKLSDPEENSFETAHKHTKLHNQTNSIHFIGNQLDVEDSVSNHVGDHNQIIESYDKLIDSNVQNNEDSSMTSVLVPQENFSANSGKRLDFHELLPITKEIIGENINEHKHIHMNGHTISGKPETISSMETPESEQQPIFESINFPVEEMQSIQSYTSDNYGEYSNTQADNIEANSRIDRVMRSITQPPSQLTESIDRTNSLTTNKMEKFNNYNKNISSISITSKFSNLPSNENFLNLSKDNGSPINKHHGGKSINTHIRVRRQVFLCAACGTYFEKWNLFYHIREVHNKFICLFENCLGIFPNAERLVYHLESKHVKKPFVYEHKDDLLKSLKKQCFLMCCVCEHIFTEKDDVTAHSCETFMKPCSACGLTFIHKSSCSALLSNKTTRHKQKRPIVSSNAIQEMNSLQVNTMPNNISQQTFLRNALLGQEMRLNRYNDYNNLLGISQVSMADHRLNKLPVNPHLHTYPHSHSSPHSSPSPSRLQSQIHPQLHQPVSHAMNEDITQQPTVISIYIIYLFISI